MNTKQRRLNEVTSTIKSLNLKDITQFVYLCQVLSFLLGIPAIIGMIINYFKLKEVENIWLETHFRWQLTTFWGFVAGLVFGFLLIPVLIGYLILLANIVWIIYRAIKGWILLNEDKPIILVADLAKAMD